MKRVLLTENSSQVTLIYSQEFGTVSKEIIRSAGNTAYFTPDPATIWAYTNEAGSWVTDPTGDHTGPTILHIDGVDLPTISNGLIIDGSVAGDIYTTALIPGSGISQGFPGNPALPWGVSQATTVEFITPATGDTTMTGTADWYTWSAATGSIVVGAAVAVADIFSMTAAHGYVTGQPVRYHQEDVGGTALPIANAAFVDGSVYYVIYDPTTMTTSEFSLAATYADAIANPAVPLAVAIAGGPWGVADVFDPVMAITLLNSTTGLIQDIILSDIEYQYYRDQFQLIEDITEDRVDYITTAAAFSDETWHRIEFSRVRKLVSISTSGATLTCSLEDPAAVTAPRGGSPRPYANLMDPLFVQAPPSYPKLFSIAVLQPLNLDFQMLNWNSGIKSMWVRGTGAIPNIIAY